MGKELYYELVDSEGSYGIVACELPEREFSKLVEKYKELIEFLQERGIDAYLVEPTEIYF